MIYIKDGCDRWMVYRDRSAWRRRMKICAKDEEIYRKS